MSLAINKIEDTVKINKFLKIGTSVVLSLGLIGVIVINKNLYKEDEFIKESFNPVINVIQERLNIESNIEIKRKKEMRKVAINNPLNIIGKENLEKMDEEEIKILDENLNKAESMGLFKDEDSYNEELNKIITNGKYSWLDIRSKTYFENGVFGSHPRFVEDYKEKVLKQVKISKKENSELREKSLKI